MGRAPAAHHGDAAFIQGIFGGLSIGAHQSACTQKYTAEIAGDDAAHVPDLFPLEHVEHRLAGGALGLTVIGVALGAAVFQAVAPAVVAGIVVLFLYLFDAFTSLFFAFNTKELADEAGAFFHQLSLGIGELGAAATPRLDVFNKCDMLTEEIMPHGEDIVSVSARTGEGLDKLLQLIDKRLDKGTRRVTLHIPYDKGSLLDVLYREAKVESVGYSETIDVVAVCDPRVLGQMAEYVEE